jgi:hypothetical protein
MDLEKENLSLDYVRRYGAEIEINAFDSRNRPVGHEDGVLPNGIYHVGNLVHSVTNERVLIRKWGHDHNNEVWVVKPDASCGMEICTPVLKGWNGVMRLCRVLDAFKEDRKIVSDERCSFHVHVDVSDLNEIQIASIITWWIKCEPVFLDSVPVNRKKNQYCQFLGLSDIFDDIENGLYPPEVLIKKLGGCKYYTLNTFHYQNKKRKTIEFRIMDSECCKNAWMAKNWIRLIIHFVETSLSRGQPHSYQFGDKWSGYCWLDPLDVFEFLGFKPNQNKISAGMQQVRSWFLSRLASQSKNTGLQGVMSDMARRISHEQIDCLREDFKNEIIIGTQEDIYSDKFRV